jgi:hypothetical protein
MAVFPVELGEAADRGEQQLPRKPGKKKFPAAGFPSRGVGKVGRAAKGKTSKNRLLKK